MAANAAADPATAESAPNAPSADPAAQLRRSGISREFSKYNFRTRSSTIAVLGHRLKGVAENRLQLLSSISRSSDDTGSRGSRSQSPAPAPLPEKHPTATLSLSKDTSVPNQDVLEVILKHKTKTKKELEDAFSHTSELRPADFTNNLISLVKAILEIIQNTPQDDPLMLSAFVALNRIITMIYSEDLPAEFTFHQEAFERYIDEDFEFLDVSAKLTSATQTIFTRDNSHSATPPSSLPAIIPVALAFPHVCRLALLSFKLASNAAQPEARKSMLATFQAQVVQLLRCVARKIKGFFACGLGRRRTSGEPTVAQNPLQGVWQAYTSLADNMAVVFEYLEEAFDLATATAIGVEFITLGFSADLHAAASHGMLALVQKLVELADEGSAVPVAAIPVFVQHISQRITAHRVASSGTSQEETDLQKYAFQVLGIMHEFLASVQPVPAATIAALVPYLPSLLRLAVTRLLLLGDALRGSAADGDRKTEEAAEEFSLYAQSVWTACKLLRPAIDIPEMLRIVNDTMARRELYVHMLTLFSGVLSYATYQTARVGVSMSTSTSTSVLIASSPSSLKLLFADQLKLATALVNCIQLAYASPEEPLSHSLQFANALVSYMPTLLYRMRTLLPDDSGSSEIASLAKQAASLFETTVKSFGVGDRKLCANMRNVLPYVPLTSLCVQLLLDPLKDVADVGSKVFLALLEDADSTATVSALEDSAVLALHALFTTLHYAKMAQARTAFEGMERAYKERRKDCSRALSAFFALVKDMVLCWERIQACSNHTGSATLQNTLQTEDALVRLMDVFAAKGKKSISLHYVRELATFHQAAGNHIEAATAWMKLAQEYVGKHPPAVLLTYTTHRTAKTDGFDAAVTLFEQAAQGYARGGMHDQAALILKRLKVHYEAGRANYTRISAIQLQMATLFRTFAETPTPQYFLVVFGFGEMFGSLQGQAYVYQHAPHKYEGESFLERLLSMYGAQKTDTSFRSNILSRCCAGHIAITDFPTEGFLFCSEVTPLPKPTKTAVRRWQTGECMPLLIVVDSFVLADAQSDIELAKYKVLADRPFPLFSHRSPAKLVIRKMQTARKRSRASRQ